MPKKDERTLNEKIQAYSQKDYKKLRRYLLSVALGKVKEKKVTREGIVVEVDVSHKDRIAASKLLKEMQIDKAVGDKKDNPIPDDTAKSLVEAIAEVHAKKQAELEEKAMKEGKLKRMDA